jgi:hypothetical protein
VRRIETTSATLVWSPDGTLVTKRRWTRPGEHSRFRNELRVNRLIGDLQPDLITPRLLDHHTQRRELTFEAVYGDPLGPKYPDRISDDDLQRCLTVERRIRAFQPRRRWLRRVDVRRRLQFAARSGWINDGELHWLSQLASRGATRLTFAHGDLIPRNLIDTGDELVLIDWEWAGLHPPGYDLATLWFTLVDVPGARTRLEALVDVDEVPFLLSALVVQLWHLQWFTPPAFQPRHLETRDHLLQRLAALSS